MQQMKIGTGKSKYAHTMISGAGTQLEGVITLGWACAFTLCTDDGL